MSLLSRVWSPYNVTMAKEFVLNWHVRHAVIKEQQQSYFVNRIVFILISFIEFKKSVISREVSSNSSSVF